MGNEKKDSEQRVRMNFTTTAKGLAQFDITCEFPTVEECKAELDKAVKALREVLKSNGIQEAGAA